MGRGSGSGKRQQGSGTHRDQRHDNGLVSSTRRTAGRKGNDQFDGSARSADPVAGRAGPSSPSPGLLQSQADANFAKNGSDASIETRPGDAHRRHSLGTSSEAASESAQSNASSSSLTVDSGARQIDVNSVTNGDLHKDTGPFELIATIVKSLPLQDTLAILIILMHVPYFSLTVVYAAFAVITFAPPVSTKTGININFAEILDNNSSAPSLITILCMDFFFFLVWVFLWQPIQDSILEFAKAVIAVFLGGGTSAKDGTSRGVTTSFVWLLLHQAIRATKSHWAKLARHFPENWPLPNILSEPFEKKPLVYRKRNAHGWIQSTLAMHILAQGIVRFVREWYLKREKANAGFSLGDPEAGKSTTAGASSLAGSNVPHPLESAHDGGTNTADADGGLSAMTSMKRRRKQNAQVRLQQPFWAALASTKIAIVKGNELSDYARGEAVTSHNLKMVHNIISQPFQREPGQIWISYVGNDEICFGTSRFPDPATLPPIDDSDVVLPPGVDITKPFYVRINNAFWGPTRISPFQEDEPEGEEWAGEGPRWTGDIYALRPISTYVCEFVDVRTGDVIFSITVRTVREFLQTREAREGFSPPGQQPLRPDSPATVIRNSVAAEEARLAEEKLRLKIFRKESKTKINSIRKENELVDNQLASAGSSDEKHRQRIRQHETQKVQAEREMEVLEEQLSNFDGAPELTERRRKLDKMHAAERKDHDTAQKRFDQSESHMDREIRAREVDKANLSSRRNKIGLRIDKVEKELRNIADANVRGLNEADRRRQEHAIWTDNMTAMATNYQDRIQAVQMANLTRGERLRTLEAQLQGFSHYLASVLDFTPDEPTTGLFRPQPPASSWAPNPAMLPRYPTGIWTGSSGDLGTPGSAPPTQSGLIAWPTAPTTVASFEPRRGRSSSMLSDVSGFTEASDEAPLKPPEVGIGLFAAEHSGRNGTSGSTGSTGSTGSVSVGEPGSPK
ncbi:hypothetical protein AAL_02306 [Moelleriella libera RCEF 2490]|uniref:Ubiquitination network signaling protein n=1 Tax=Moelleriella libera RCEF 2490 TaxID=1081109 RepID=A0A168FCV7_9HYPO|nr:hypothetical protein AAL_02306 [Moelleriella libera RCEF 2490]